MTRSSAAPRLLVVTDRSQVPTGRTLPQVVAACLEGGARHILLRERDLSARQHARMVEEITAPVAARHGILLLAAPAEPAAEQGLHLRARDGRPDRRPALLGRSVHNAPEALQAVRDRCDYVTVSPVHPTPSKPGYGPTLGARGLHALVDDVDGIPPVLALGGVRPDHVADLCAAGAHGVAVMGSVMRALDPAALIAAYLRALPCDTGAETGTQRS